MIQWREANINMHTSSSFRAIPTFTREEALCMYEKNADKLTEIAED